MAKQKYGVRPKRKEALLPIVSNLILFVFTAGVLWAAVAQYQERIREATLAENRFLTTEWQLLQEMKRETDQRLAEKDREIAALRREYERMRRGDQSQSDLSEIEARLRQAREERDRILSRLMEGPLDLSPPADQDARGEESVTAGQESPTGSEPPLWSTLSSATAGRSVIDDIVQRRIAALNDELEALQREQERTRREYEAVLEQTVRRSEDSAERLNRAREAAAAAREELERRRREIEAGGHPSVDDLNTRALLRALVTVPAIRAEYPNLLESLDRYFEVYGLQKRLEGRREAYAEAEEVVEAVIEEIEAP